MHDPLNGIHLKMQSKKETNQRETRYSWDHDSHLAMGATLLTVVFDLCCLSGDHTELLGQADAEGQH